MRIHDEMLALKHLLSLETESRALTATELQIARLNLLIGEDEQALLFVDVAYQRAKAAGYPTDEALAKAIAARAYAQREERDVARECLVRARAVAEQSDSFVLQLETAEAALAIGDTALARELCSRLDDAAPDEGPDNDINLTRADLLRSSIAAADGQGDAAYAASVVALERADKTKKSYWRGLAIMVLARAERARGRVNEARAAYDVAVAHFEAQAEDTLIAEAEIELALFAAENGQNDRPPAYWLGQALGRLQSSGQHRIAQRARALLKTHGRRLTDKLLDAHALSELSGIQSEVARAQNETRAVDELMQRLLDEMDRAALPEGQNSVAGFLRESVAEHIGHAGHALSAVARRHLAFANTVQELCLDQDRFADVLQAIEGMFSTEDDTRLPGEITRAVGRLTGAALVSLLLRERNGEAVVVASTAPLAADERVEAERFLFLSPLKPNVEALDATQRERTREASKGMTETPSVMVEQLSKDGRVFGVIYCKRSSGRFSPATLRQLRRFMPLISTLLDNRRIAAERQLDASTRRATLEAITDAVFMLKDDDTLLAMNARAAAVIGRSDSAQLVLASDYPSLREVSLELRGGETQQLDGRVVAIQDAQYLLNARAVPDANGWVLTMTELKRAASMVQNIVGTKARYTFKDIVGRSEALHKLVQLAEQLASLPTSVLVSGESGTGKEMFAQAIHNAGRRRHAPFVAVNCAAIPRDLLESELFGYEPGAFTGALKRGRPGKFELADGGTLFLDEIGEMPMEMQSKLLRVLQEKQVERLGAGRAMPIDVRIVAATNRRLEDWVARGLFRQDLYFRLRGVYLYIPPLRERPEDITVLVEHLMQTLPQRFNKRVRRVSDDVMQYLVRYRWPGNVRELEQAIELEISLAPATATVIDWLPSLLETAPSEEAPRVEGDPQPESTPAKDDALSLERQERALLIEALRRFHGSIPDVARAVGVSRATVYNKLSKYNIAAKDFRE